MKWLIINSDDFGLDPAVNAAVIQAHTEGILTSASLLVAAPHAAEAIELARQHPKLGVGLHLCLVQGKAAALPEKIAPLADAAGNLPNGLLRLSALLMKDSRTRAAIELELRAQFERFLATGMQPTHLDSHMHTHMHPQVLPIVVRLAQEYQIKWVRAPHEPLLPSLSSSPRRLVSRLARWPVFAVLGTRAGRHLRAANLATPDRAAGVLNPGQLTEEFLVAYLSRLAEGRTEIFFHPATATNAALAACQPGYQHAGERRALCSISARAVIVRAGIRLVNYRDLPADAHTG